MQEMIPALAAMAIAVAGWLFARHLHAAREASSAEAAARVQPDEAQSDVRPDFLVPVVINRERPAVSVATRKSPGKMKIVPEGEVVRTNNLYINVVESFQPLGKPVVLAKTGAGKRFSRTSGRKRTPAETGVKS